MTDPAIALMTFVFGLCVGSFLNVCIYRLPLARSIVFPGSCCPQCNRPIRYYDNIPVLSYLWLKGRCRHCRNLISPRYPIVEMIAAVLALCTYLKFGLSLESLIYYTFMASLLAVTFIDIDHRIIPDRITLPGIPVFFLAALALPSITFIDSLLGLLIGGGILFLIGSVYLLFTKKEGMGGGDIKLLAMIGTLIGFKGVFFTIFVSSAIGTLVGIVVMLRTKKGTKLALPFGPFLSLGAILYIFYGTQVLNWYLYR